MSFGNISCFYNSRFNTSFILVLFLILFLSSPLLAADSPAKGLVNKLQSGGYNIYFRHTQTGEQSDGIDEFGDWVSCDPDDMRQLSKETATDGSKL